MKLHEQGWRAGRVEGHAVVVREDATTLQEAPANYVRIVLMVPGKCIGSPDAGGYDEIVKLASAAPDMARAIAHLLAVTAGERCPFCMRGAVGDVVGFHAPECPAIAALRKAGVWP